MNLPQVIVLAIVQGLTEFLPISSSGHLILSSWIFSWEDQGLPFDVALHIGTLVAVLCFFRREWIDLARGFSSTFTGDKQNDSHLSVYRRLSWLLIVGTIPAGVAGIFAEGILEDYFRSPLTVGWFLVGTGSVLWLSEILGARARSLENLGVSDSIVVGIAQIGALIPGVSRSGVTMASGLFMGLSREAAARFSYLLGTPLIFGAGILEIWNLVEAGGSDTHWDAMLLGASISAVIAFMVIKAFLALLRRTNLMAMVVYCFSVGAGVIIVEYAVR